MPLLHVLATHARPLDNISAWITWQQLTGAIFIGQTPSEEDKHKIMPLLLRDPLALLIQFVLILPLNMDQSKCSFTFFSKYCLWNTWMACNGFWIGFSAYFTCIVKFLYNLLYFQVIAQLSGHLSESERDFFRMSNPDTNSNLRERFSLDHAFKYTIESLDKVLLYSTTGSPSGSSDREPAHENLELQVSYFVEWLCQIDRISWWVSLFVKYLGNMSQKSCLNICILWWIFYKKKKSLEHISSIFSMSWVRSLQKFSFFRLFPSCLQVSNKSRLVSNFLQKLDLRINLNFQKNWNPRSSLAPASWEVEENYV